MRNIPIGAMIFSLLTPGFKNGWWRSALHPLGGSCQYHYHCFQPFVYAGLFIGYAYNALLLRALIAVCLLLYLVGDHLDGIWQRGYKPDRPGRVL